MSRVDLQVFAAVADTGALGRATPSRICCKVGLDVELHATAEMATSGAFMRGVVAAFPYRIHTVLTDNGVAFTNCASSRWDGMVLVFDRVCNEHGITHRRTKPYHPWTNGQAERMNRTVKEATGKVFHYETLESLTAHVQAFVRAYNFAKHLKRLRWRTPFQAICDAWATDPEPFKINPHHLIPGPNMLAQAWHLATIQLHSLTSTARICG